MLNSTQLKQESSTGANGSAVRIVYHRGSAM